MLLGIQAFNFKICSIQAFDFKISSIQAFHTPPGGPPLGLFYQQGSIWECKNNQCQVATIAQCAVPAQLCKAHILSFMDILWKFLQPFWSAICLQTRSLMVQSDCTYFQK